MGKAEAVAASLAARLRVQACVTRGQRALDFTRVAHAPRPLPPGDALVRRGLTAVEPQADRGSVGTPPVASHGGAATPPPQEAVRRPAPKLRVSLLAAAARGGTDAAAAPVRGATETVPAAMTGGAPGLPGRIRVSGAKASTLREPSRDTAVVSAAAKTVPPARGAAMTPVRAADVAGPAATLAARAMPSGAVARLPSGAAQEALDGVPARAGAPGPARPGAPMAPSGWARQNRTLLQAEMPGGPAPPEPGKTLMDGAPFAAPSGDQAAAASPTGGDVYLDGTLMGRWVARNLADQASRPASGGSGFDPRRGVLPTGAMIGG